MKTIFNSIVVLSFLALLNLPTSLQALDGPHVTYTATMTGIDCNGCKRTIAESLGKIKGVEKVKIKKRSSGEHLLTVITDGSTQISKERASRAVEKADHYKLLSWHLK